MNSYSSLCWVLYGRLFKTSPNQMPFKYVFHWDHLASSTPAASSLSGGNALHKAWSNVINLQINDSHGGNHDLWTAFLAGTWRGPPRVFSKVANRRHRKTHLWSDWTDGRQAPCAIIPHGAGIIPWCYLQWSWIQPTHTAVYSESIQYVIRHDWVEGGDVEGAGGTSKIIYVCLPVVNTAFHLTWCQTPH